MSGRKRQQVRVSRKERSDLLSDIYGSYNGDYKSLSRISHKSPPKEREALSLIDQFYGIEFMASLREEAEQAKSLQMVRDMHSSLTKILNKLNDTPQGVIVVAEAKKVNKMNRTIDDYNWFVNNTPNQLLLVEFNHSLLHIKPPMLSIYGGELELTSRGISSSSSAILSIHSDTPSTSIWNKKEWKEYNDNQRKYWLCKKCGFGHMLFEELI